MAGVCYVYTDYYGGVAGVCHVYADYCGGWQVSVMCMLITVEGGRCLSCAP